MMRTLGLALGIFLPGSGLVSGQITLPGAVFALSDAAAAPGATVTIHMYCDNSAGAASGWSMSVCHDPSLVSVLDVTHGSTTATIKGGSPPDFSFTEIFSDGWAAGIVICGTGCAPLPQGYGYHLHDADYDLVTSLPAVAQLDFCELGTYILALFVGGAAVVPQQISGAIGILEPRFQRGDSTGDGAIDVADAIALLEALFVTPTPLSCPDACDGNDDGVIDIADAVSVLLYLFASGPTPPPPFPSCGPDPTADALRCTIVSPTCL